MNRSVRPDHSDRVQESKNKDNLLETGEERERTLRLI